MDALLSRFHPHFAGENSQNSFRWQQQTNPSKVLVLLLLKQKLVSYR